MPMLPFLAVRHWAARAARAPHWPRVDVARAALQSSLLGLAVASLESTVGLSRFDRVEGMRFMLSIFLLHWTQAMPLAVTAQVVEGRLAKSAMASLFAAEVVLLSAMASGAVGLPAYFQRLAGLTELLPPSPWYMLWTLTVYGGVFFVYALTAQRALRVRDLLARMRAERGRSAAVQAQVQVESLEGRIDPALMLRALATARAAYPRSREDAGRTLDALVVFLRRAMPSVRQGRTLLQDELLLLQAYLRLMRQLDPPVPVEVHVDGDPVLAASTPFAPHVLVPVVEQLVAACDAGTEVRIKFAATNEGVRLTMEAAVPHADWMSTALARRIDHTLAAMAPAAFRWQCATSPAWTVWSLPPHTPEDTT